MAALLLIAIPARSELVVNWGSPVYSSLANSYGQGLDASYTFELGAFDPAFTPTATNITDWASNWKIFDRAAFNVPADHFASTADLLDNGTSSSSFADPAGYDFRGLNAYIWGYNTKAYTQTLEWVWFRAPSWAFPTTYTAGPPITPTEWSTTDLVPGDTPLFGRQATDVGLGYASAPGTLGQYDLQTYTLEGDPEVPEPSTVVFAALLVAAVIFHRWRARVARPVTIAPLLVAGLLGMQSVTMANRINFYSDLGSPGVASTGQPLDANTYFELGVFTGGFVPTAENTAEWATHWVAAQRTEFNTSHNWFTAVFPVTSNAVPFTAGTPAYVWGFSGSEAQGQWILFRSTSWVWPVASDIAPVPLYWSSKDANVVVVGSLPPIDGRVGVRTAAMAGSPPPVTTWTQWKLSKLRGLAQANADEDADHDGVANLLEYVTGTGPANAKERPNPSSWLQTGSASGRRYLEIRVPRRRDHPANLVIEVSDDLNTWTSGSTATETVEDTAEALTVRDRTPISEGEAGGASRRFMRVRAATTAP